ncbi:MAG: hypothetical protein KKH94_11755 [Candidatus Omnitrophica bacterium]|nr:hypothetical protein [Candidatus Omnitrophota bacterium]
MVYQNISEGKGLDKNIPMGKFQNMPFPVISDKAKERFMSRGIEFFDLSDVAVESEFTAEGPMWAHNFDFQKDDIPSDDASSDYTPAEDPRIERILKPTTPEALMKAQEFYVDNMIKHLRKVMAKDPDKVRFLAINMQIGGEYQQAMTNSLFRKISELHDEGEFKNLLTTRGRNAEDLSSKINDLVYKTKGLRMEDVIIVTRNIDIEQKKFSKMEGRAIIAAIEDRNADGLSYLPILETISIALGVAYGANYKAMKSIYDLITAGFCKMARPVIARERSD